MKSSISTNAGKESILNIVKIQIRMLSFLVLANLWVGKKTMGPLSCNAYFQKMIVMNLEEFEDKSFKELEVC